VSILLGLPRDRRAIAALQLAAQFARSLREDLVVCTVVPAPWPPGVGRIDAEYQEHIDRLAAEAVESAREAVPSDVTATFHVERSRSIPGGLLDIAERFGAQLLVLGSAKGGGGLGRVAFGSVTERLLHSSPIPVAIAPRGFRCRPTARVTRVTAAYGASEESADLVVAAAGVASRLGVALRVASFAVRPRTPLTAGIGSRAEAAVLTEWSEDVARAQQKVLDRVAGLPEPPPSSAVIGRGTDWDDALEDVDWTEGDVLAVGSSSVGPVARVFLGSRSSKIVRSSPVPVVVVPRSAVEELADEAAGG
jgi:nucleotide-binding universal stress UspA family protein